MPGVEQWILEDLLDAFEPTALKAAADAADKPKPAGEKSE